MSTPPPNRFVPLSTNESNTIQFEKTILLIIRSETVLVRLQELCHLLFDDFRIQCLFTIPEPLSRFDRHLAGTLQSYGCVVVPWDIALQHSFDLAIACSPNGSIELVRAPLLILEHGPALSKPAAKSDTLDLISRLKTRSFQSIFLKSACFNEIEESADNITSTAMGDPVYDSLILNARSRPIYREALGIRSRKLVTLSSTWGPDSLLSQWPTLAKFLIENMPGTEYVFALILHPYIWAAHGAWQIEAWLRKELASGLLLIPHMQGWQGCILASDCIIGDHGSVTHYSSLLGLQTMLIRESKCGMATEIPLVSQTLENSLIPKDQYDVIRFIESARRIDDLNPDGEDELFPNIGKSIEKMRELIYSTLGLAQPKNKVNPIHISIPHPISKLIPLFRTALSVQSDSVNTKTIEIRAYPAMLPSDNIVTDGMLLAIIDDNLNHLAYEANILIDCRPYNTVKEARSFSHFRRSEYLLQKIADEWHLYDKEHGSAHIIHTSIDDPAVLGRTAVYLLEEKQDCCLVRCNKQIETAEIIHK